MRWVSQGLCGLAVLLVSAAAAAGAQPEGRAYPALAPLQQYRSASTAEEIALARSAAPAAISEKAEILALGAGGYQTAAKGANGFVCLVERSWGTGFDDPQFWNSKVRSPMCFNASAARSVLPAYLERTRSVLAGVSRARMLARAKAQAARPGGGAPQAGAMCFMMSKQGYLADGVGHAHPHLMFFMPRTAAGAWGANLPGSPVAADQGAPEAVTTFFVTVTRWSDGTSAMDMK
jgi:hypothetical protein